MASLLRTPESAPQRMARRIRLKSYRCGAIYDMGSAGGVGCRKDASVLALTKKTGYALMALKYLATLGDGELASARTIAARLGVPAPALMNILKELAAGGYVRSVRGVRGGYCLERSPAEVSLADVIHDLEGPGCLCGDGPLPECTCGLFEPCLACHPVRRVHRRLKNVLETLSLAEIVGPAAGAVERKGEVVDAR